MWNHRITKDIKHDNPSYNLSHLKYSFCVVVVKVPAFLFFFTRTKVRI